MMFSIENKVETEGGYESVRRDVRLEGNDPEAISLRWWLTAKIDPFFIMEHLLNVTQEVRLLEFTYFMLVSK